jgi:amino acid transporter
VLAFALCSTLLVTRMLYAMSRIGVMPPWLNKLDPRYGTPHRAVGVEVVVALVVGLAMGQIFGPPEAFFIYGLAATLLSVSVYVVGNGAVLTYFRRNAPQDFNVVRHVVFPALSSAALVYVFYKTVSPFPAYPIAGGIWWALGWAIVGVLLAVKFGARASRRQLLGADNDGDTG